MKFLRDVFFALNIIHHLSSAFLVSSLSLCLETSSEIPTSKAKFSSFSLFSRHIPRMKNIRTRSKRVWKMSFPRKAYFRNSSQQSRILCCSLQAVALLKTLNNQSKTRTSLIAIRAPMGVILSSNMQMSLKRAMQANRTKTHTPRTCFGWNIKQCAQMESRRLRFTTKN